MELPSWSYPDDHINILYLGENLYSLNTFSSNDNEDEHHWVLPSAIQLLEVRSYYTVAVGTLALMELYAGYYTKLFSHRLTGGVLAQESESKHVFNNIILQKGTDFIIHMWTEQPSYIDGSVIFREVIPKMEIPEEITTKCGIIDWLRGECVHGLS